jgi:hypothetical protein
MPRFVLIAILISSFLGSAHAFSYTGPEHIGALCTPCHDKFSYRQPYAENLSAPVRSSDVTDMYPCYKKPCHYSSPVKWGGSGNRYKRHMGEGICKNCHGKNGEFDIHKSHTKNDTTVNCNYCHSSPMGWNSSHVEVPAYEDIYIAGSALLNTSIRKPKWGNDCGYCHITVAGAKRMHNVHKLVIERACVDCHGEIIESVPNPLKKAIIEGGAPVEVKVSVAQSLMKEYYVLFDRISLQFLNFYNFMRR